MPVTSVFEYWKVKVLNRKIRSRVRLLDPSWVYIDGYYCLPDTEFFVCGFVMSHKSFGSEINTFSVPLFSKKLNFHLSYADSLPRPSSAVRRKGKNPAEIADEFLSAVAPLVQQARTRDSLEIFTQRIEENELYRNTRVAFEYSLALILKGNLNQARSHLSIVAGDEWSRRVVPDEAECASNLIALIDSNAESAVAEVNSYLENNKILMGTSSEALL